MFDTGELPTKRAAELAAELAGLDLAGLEAAFRAADQERRQAEARLALIAAQVERRRFYRVDGHATVAGWLRATGRWSADEAAHTVRLGRLIGVSAPVAGALLEGQLPFAHAAVLARAHANPRCGHQLPEVLPVLLEHAPRLAFPDFRVLVGRWVQLADVDGAHRDAETCHRRRRARLVLLDNSVHLDAQGSAAAGAAMDEILQRFCEAELHADWDDARARHGDEATPADLERTHAQRCFDALHAIFLRAAATPPSYVDPEPLVNLLADPTTLTDLLQHGQDGQDGQDEQDLPGAGSGVGDPARRRCETSSGALLTPGDLLAAALAGRIRRVIVDGAGVVIDLGRKRRLFTGGARDATLLQAQRCIWPGCLVDAGRCQVDHLTPFPHGGATRPGNGGPMCGRHNRWKTRGYRAWRDPGGCWHIYRPDGTEIT